MPPPSLGCLCAMELLLKRHNCFSHHKITHVAVVEIGVSQTSKCSRVDVIGACKRASINGGHMVFFPTCYHETEGLTDCV